MFRKPTTVCANGWSVGVTTGSFIEGARLGITRNLNGNWRTQLNPTGDGMMFATSEQAYDWAFAHGYLKVHYPRPSGFIALKLSPATRRYLKALPAEKRLSALRKIFKDFTAKDYFKAVLLAPYMADTRARWEHYMETGGDLNNVYHVRRRAA